MDTCYCVHSRHSTAFTHWEIPVGRRGRLLGLFQISPRQLPTRYGAPQHRHVASREGDYRPAPRPILVILGSSEALLPPKPFLPRVLFCAAPRLAPRRIIWIGAVLFLVTVHFAYAHHRLQTSSAPTQVTLRRCAARFLVSANRFDGVAPTHRKRCACLHSD